jgi:hypothetical protein
VVHHPPKKDRFDTFLLVLIVALLGAVGTLTLVVNSQTKELAMTLHSLTWTKLDKMSTLFLAERDRIEKKLERACEDIHLLEQRHLQDLRDMDRRNGNGKGGAKERK